MILPDTPVARSVKNACARIQQAGHDAMITGGAVRDLLMGKTPKDFDIATSAMPEELEGLFSHTVSVGKKFGTIILIHENQSIETTTFRKEGPYPDGRHPAWIRPGTLETDAMRRDFTINALYLDPVREKLFDPVDGKRDIESKILRSIGRPSDRFQEDHLRILRLVRFSAQLGFDVDPDTAEAAGRLAPLVARVSAERIAQELDRAWESPRPVKALDMLSDFGLLRVLLPEVEAMKGVQQPPEFHPEGDVYTHTRLLIVQLSNAPADLVWGALLHDIGKPPTFSLDHSSNPPRIRFNRHDMVGAQMTRAILERFRFSRKRIDRIVGLVKQHMRLRSAPEMRKGKLSELLDRPNIDMEMELHRIDCLAASGKLDAYDFLQNQKQQKESEPPVPPPFLTGRDLIDQGLSPGPIFSPLLNEARALQLDEVLQSREEAISWLRQKIEKLPESPGKD
jgi:poly(A) polymerase